MSVNQRSNNYKKFPNFREIIAGILGTVSFQYSHTKTLYINGQLIYDYACHIDTGLIVLGVTDVLLALSCFSLVEQTRPWQKPFRVMYLVGILVLGAYRALLGAGMFSCY